MAENFFGITDTGKLRSNNEDTFIAELVCNSKLIAACVIDGVGGYAGGEIAARLAREEINDHLNTITGTVADDILKKLKGALIFANEKIYKEKQVNEQNALMACVVTLALADINHNKFYYAHVGDTRLYLLRDKTLVKITRDHSTIGFLEESGRLSEEAAMHHPKRNEISKALGFQADINLEDDFIETGESPFLPGDIILLCSDGLTDMINSRDITSVINADNSLAVKSKALIDAANAAGGRDNITVVLVQNNKSPIQQFATKPASALLKIESEETEDKLNDSIEPGTKSIDKQTRTNRKNNKLVPVLVVLCTIFLSGFLWLLVNRSSAIKKVSQEKVQLTDFKKARNQTEQTFLNNINDTLNKVLDLKGLGSDPIVISDTIFIKKDSLLIIGNGTTLLRDSAYNGPGLVLSPDCSFIVLDSIVLEDFDVAILVHNKNLHLRNVQFKNCRVPVLQQFLLPLNISVTGRLDTLNYTIDSAK